MPPRPSEKANQNLRRSQARQEKGSVGQTAESPRMLPQSRRIRGAGRCPREGLGAPPDPAAGGGSLVPSACPGEADCLERSMRCSRRARWEVSPVPVSVLHITGKDAGLSHHSPRGAENRGLWLIDVLVSPPQGRGRCGRRCLPPVLTGRVWNPARPQFPHRHRQDTQIPASAGCCGNARSLGRRPPGQRLSERGPRKDAVFSRRRRQRN